MLRRKVSAEEHRWVARRHTSGISTAESSAACGCTIGVRPLWQENVSTGAMGTGMSGKTHLSEGVLVRRAKVRRWADGGSYTLRLGPAQKLAAGHARHQRYNASLQSCHTVTHAISRPILKKPSRATEAYMKLRSKNDPKQASGIMHYCKNLAAVRLGSDARCGITTSSP